MHKIVSLTFTFLIIYFQCRSQNKNEHLQLDWPVAYKWKIVNQQNDSSIQSVTIIPGFETIKTATIMGNMIARVGVIFPKGDQMLEHYRNSIDTGSVLTVIERNDNAQYPWLIFKVETPVTAKYPEPESDLYYVIQGAYALYENYVSIKKPTLSKKFLEKWTEVFKAAKITIE